MVCCWWLGLESVRALCLFEYWRWRCNSNPTSHVVLYNISIHASDVAMVIITTLIAKIYFPESLERRGPRPTMPRSYSYRRSADAVPPESSSSQSDTEDQVLDSGDDRDEEEEEDDPEESDLLRNHPNHSKRYNILEFDQDRTSKAQVMRRLLFCSLMLNITFVSWGFLQVSTVLSVYCTGTNKRVK
jgi:hypothetical protein